MRECLWRERAPPVALNGVADTARLAVVSAFPDTSKKARMLFRERSATVPGEQIRKNLIAARARAKLKSLSRSCGRWAEDHAQPAIAATAAIAILTAGALLLWKWAELISIVVQLAAVLTILAVTLSASSAALNWLKRRRDSRLPPIGDQDTGLLATTPAPALAEAGEENHGEASEESRPVERG